MSDAIPKASAADVNGASAQTRMSTEVDPPFLQRAIAVLTVNWNRPALTLACLQALRQSKEVRWHLFIVDNASTDDSVKRLSGLGADVTLVEATRNGGWSGGNNLGARRALEAGFDLLFFLNNDALVAPETLKALLTSFDDVGTPLPVLGAIQIDDAHGEGTWYGSLMPARGPFPVDMTRSDHQEAPEFYSTQFVKGAALFAHRAHFERIGFFDDRFFLNFEETDWCMRARAAGFPILMTKRARVRHSGSGTMGGLASPLSTYFLIRNALLYSELHGDAWSRLGGVKERMSWILHRYGTANWARAAFRHLRDQSPWAMAYRRGFIDYLFRRFGDCPPVIRELNQRARR